MSWSLNEIEGTARKAARGAGLPWGLAEEAGKATRWLCAAGWPGAECLAAHLTDNDGAAWDEICPQDTQTVWQAKGGVLCPLATGAVFCDRAREWARGQRAELGTTAYPILLIPYMVWAADIADAALEITWAGARVVRAAGETYPLFESSAALTTPRADHVSLGPAAAVAGTAITRVYRAEVSPEAVRVLTDLAQRTYAPETPESRRAGAGAEQSDND